MKNYIVDKKGEEKFIREVKKCSNGTLTLKFADGKVFKNVTACDENINKIIETQEAQAKEGMINYKTFVKREHNAGMAMAASGLVTLMAATGATYIPQIHEALSTQNPVLVATGIGAITVLGMIPAYCKLRKNKQTVKEIDKLRYRESNMEDLKAFRNYPNALADVNSKVANWMKKEKDPFSILNIDNYSRADLEQIISNIDVEQAYNFTYKNESPKTK